MAIIFPDYIRDAKVAGKNTWLLAVRALLGEEITTMEWRMAKNDDTANYKGFEKKVAELEQFMSSEDFTNQYGVAQAEKDAEAILREGYKQCVLQHTELENKLIKVVRESIAYAKKLNSEKDQKNIGNSGVSVDRLPGMLSGQGIMYFANLDNALTTRNYQWAWIILCSWIHPDWQMVTINIGIFFPKDVEEAAKSLRDVMTDPTIQNAVPKEVLAGIPEEIQAGISLSYKIHPVAS